MKGHHAQYTVIRLSLITCYHYDNHLYYTALQFCSLSPVCKTGSYFFLYTCLLQQMRDSFDQIEERSDRANVKHAMYNDFIHLVHNKQVDLNLSPSIQNCCDYIYLHTEEKISLAKLAKRFGYVDYYLSRKFKQETGVSINDYIKTAKIEKAKTLLLSSDLSIQEICDRLQFGSRSFFAETFKNITGQPPAAYRRQHSV